MLSPEDVRLLSQLSLRDSGATTRAMSAALRRARMQGPGLEFHEYRHYQPGDDPRSIDWTIEARLRQLVVRVARADGHLNLHVLVDVSRSMTIGSPDKLSCARQVAAALCFVASERRDAAGLGTFDHDLRDLLPPATGRGQLQRVLATLEARQPAGRSDLAAALTRYGAAVHGPGLVVVISDFLSRDPDLSGLDFLLYRGLTPAVVQILAPEERDPSFDDAELIDAEDDGAPAMIVDRSSIAGYKVRLDAHQAFLGAFCAERGIPVVLLDASLASGNIIRALERAGLLSGRT